MENPNFTFGMMRRMFGLAMSLVGLAFSVSAAPLLVDTFTDGNSQNQDLGANSVRVFNGRTANTRTEAVGGTTWAISSSSSEALWFFFTEPRQPVALQPGERLRAAMTFVLGSAANGNIRLTLANSQGTRNVDNLTGGQNNSTFADDTAYGFEWVANASGTGNPFNIGRRSATPSGANNPLNSFADFPLLPYETGGTTERTALLANVRYTVTLSAERLGDGSMRVGIEATGGAHPANYVLLATDSSASVVSAFDYFTLRIGGSSFTSSIRVTRLEVDYLPALPVITQQPFPAELTVAAGGQLALSVLATGAGLTYQWQRDLNDVPGQTSANLLISDITLAQAGSYRCVVSNAAGSVPSQAVAVTVSSGPVDPRR